MFRGGEGPNDHKSPEAQQYQMQKGMGNLQDRKLINAEPLDASGKVIRGTKNQ